MSPSQTAVSPAFGLNLIGFFGSDTGLGNTARAFGRVLDQAGVANARVDISAEMSRSETHAAQEARIRSGLVHPINLHIVTAGLESVLMRRELLFSPGLMQVGMLWWETTVLPPSFVALWRGMDAVVACSPFIAGVAANHLSLTPVVAAKHPLPDMDGVRPDRAGLGLPSASLIFATSFDALSDLARKNPVALIHVFRTAFPDAASDVRLLVRVNHAGNPTAGRRCVEQLSQAAGGDPRVQLLTEPMDYRTVLSIYASCDVYVSMHRAEGLGLGMMEAMALGKPVIATGWSGNMDFMGHDCACLVRYALGPPGGGHTLFSEAVLGANALWATPAFDDAVAWMRRLASDPDLRAAIGDAAKRRIVRHQAEASSIGWAHELAALWRARTMLPIASDKFSVDRARA